MFSSADVQPPVISCPFNYESVLFGPNYTTVIMPRIDHPVTASDDSGSVSLAYFPEILHLNALLSTNDEVIDVVAKDEAGNTANCSYVISPVGKSQQTKLLQ